MESVGLLRLHARYSCRRYGIGMVESHVRHSLAG